MESPGEVLTALAIAQTLKQTVAGQADEIERGRALPDDLVRELKSAGVFRLLIDEAFGGKGASLPDFICALQVFAEADASTAWCVSQGAVIGTTSMWLEPATLTQFWADADTSVANGPPRGCVARRTDAGHRVTGNWGFSSGCQHATWMHGALRREDDSAWLGVFFPKPEADFNDNWQVAGLRGTGSFEFSVKDLLVPDEHVVDFRKPPAVDAPLYRIPIGLVFAVSFASVALGVARAALDVAEDLAQGKVPAYATFTVKDDPDMQKIVGEAESRFRAARAFLHASVAEVWEALTAQPRILDAQRITLRMTGTHVIREAAAVLDLAYTVAGSTAIYEINPLQRRFQDMHVITQHVQGRLGHYGLLGRYFLGHDFKPGPLN